MFQIFPDKGARMVDSVQLAIKTLIVCVQTDRGTKTDGQSNKSNQVTPGPSDFYLIYILTFCKSLH